MDFESETFLVQPAICVHGTQDPCVSTDTAFALGRNNGGENAVFAIQAGALRTNPLSGPDGVGVQADHAYTLEARSEVQAVCVTGDIAHTLKAEGFDGSEDGTGRGQPIVSVALRGRDGGATAELGDDVAGALRASQGGGDKPHALIGSAVRRLTPVECERLQGMPDNHTLIPWRGKPAEDCPDGPRYKALGNSMAVPCMFFIGSRINAAVSTSKAAKKVCA